uniref:Uncharacterized protein n=1 Tax=Rhizophora mucronata TaxID=61149 RepID=A0A2P2N9I1_RHIMU
MQNHKSDKVAIPQLQETVEQLQNEQNTESSIQELNI